MHGVKHEDNAERILECSIVNVNRMLNMVNEENQEARHHSRTCACARHVLVARCQ